MDHNKAVLHDHITKLLYPKYLWVLNNPTWEPL